MAQSVGPILLVRGGAIGDFILTLPVLMALRRNFPGVRLEILARNRTAPLAVAAGLADGWRDLEGRESIGLFVPGGEIEPSLCEWFLQFALVLSYVPDPEGGLRANFSRICSARILTGLSRPDETQPRHAAEQFLEPLRAINITELDPVPQLRIQAVPEPIPPAGRWLAVHPGSGSERKNWPEARWADLLARLGRETDWNFLIVGGEAEQGKLARLTRHLPAGRFDLAENLPLTELAARLRGGHFFLGHDSGITHLAAALGLPGLVLWGETNAMVWRPLGGRMNLLTETSGLAELTVEKVFAELQRRVHFAPMA
ncbi:MAG: hypothetical protein EXS29_02420 [Pedosphaera sp.]|nr:hypothetical protein [Pedosphaera sp.]MST00152.1 hypothetical protein [Pedosphaera sp.]